jgi:poly(A) polymerase
MPVPSGIPDLSAWGKTAPPPPPVAHDFEPGDDIGNRLAGPPTHERTTRGQDNRPRGGPRRRFGGDRRGGSDRGRDGRDRPRQPYIPGPPPPPTGLPGNPRVIARQDHSVSRKNIDPNAVNVLYRLHRAGYKAYLVGGGVRDLLLGERPKDFDVATDASPRDTKRLFPHCFIIGRRFRLCHVRFGSQVIEVATFRAKGEALELAEEKPDHGQTTLDENVFGTPEQDALRRDLTINGLFYDIGTFALIDYVGGMEDLKNRLVRMIGDPAERFREDPVRMVRVVRFAARLGFAIEPATRSALEACRGTLASANPSRMLEEWFRLLNRGAARKSIDLLRETGLRAQALPSLAKEMDDPARAQAVQAWLDALDALDPSYRPLPNALCLAGLFGERLTPLLAQAPPDADPGRIAWDALDEDFKRLQVSRRDRSILVRMILSQRHFEGNQIDPAFAGRDYFPAALDFFELKGRALGATLETLPAWRKAEAEVMRRPLGRDVGPLPSPAESGHADASGEGQPRRRRRRRGGRGGRGAPGNGAGPGNRVQSQAMTLPQGGHDLELGPPPEVVKELYAGDKDELPDWVSDEQPPS